MASPGAGDPRTTEDAPRPPASAPGDHTHEPPPPDAAPGGDGEEGGLSPRPLSSSAPHPATQEEGAAAGGEGPTLQPPPVASPPLRPPAPASPTRHDPPSEVVVDIGPAESEEAEEEPGGSTGSLPPKASSRDCRICLEACEESEKTGCNCRGTVCYAHRECVEKWVCSRGFNARCELCGEAFEGIDAARLRRVHGRRQAGHMRGDRRPITVCEQLAWIMLALSPLALVPTMVISSRAEDSTMARSWRAVHLAAFAACLACACSRSTDDVRWPATIASCIMLAGGALAMAAWHERDAHGGGAGGGH